MSEFGIQFPDGRPRTLHGTPSASKLNNGVLLAGDLISTSSLRPSAYRTRKSTTMCPTVTLLTTNGNRI